MLEIEHTPLSDCFLLKPSVFRDHRGTFSENYSKRRFEAVTGLDIDFVQDNQSYSKKGVLRGLHFQKGHFAQSKLVRCVHGEVLDVVVDLRPSSATFKQHFKTLLNQDNQHQLFVPAGFAHGFLTLSAASVFAYKCDQYFHPDADAGVYYNDPEFDIDWGFPKEDLIFSEKDLHLPLFKNLQF